MLRTSFSIILLACYFIYLLNTDMTNSVHAAQENTNELLQHDPQKISGKVTDVITAAGFTYAEVDTGKEKVWAAGPGITPLKKGDMVAFSTEMPMRNFHSKSLGRDFPVIYFIKRYITDKETLPIAAPGGLVQQQPVIKPTETTYERTPGEVKIGGQLREATLNGLNGKSKKFSDYKGKPLIINVWASWCGPCRAEMGSLERLAQRYNGKEFNLIGISTDDYRNKAEAFIKDTKITFDNFLDRKLLLENMLGANTIPLTVLVDADGRVLEKVRGPREWDDPTIIDAIGEVFHIKLMHQDRFKP
jgi:thiol-disulfide isomerase/thioredoxin